MSVDFEGAFETGVEEAEEFNERERKVRVVVSRLAVVGSVVEGVAFVEVEHVFSTRLTR